MKVYFTTEKLSKLKDVVLNIGSFYIVNVPEIVSLVDGNSAPFAEYFINTTIKDSFKKAHSSKKYSGLIYINKTIDKTTLDNLEDLAKSESFDDEYILIDNSIMQKHKSIYCWFEEIMFYTRLRKIKL